MRVSAVPGKLADCIARDGAFLKCGSRNDEGGEKRDGQELELHLEYGFECTKYYIEDCNVLLLSPKSQGVRLN